MRLAGEPGCDDIDVSSPGSGIKGFDVIPYGSGIEAVSESLLQDLLGVLVMLDIADGPGVESGKSEGKGEGSHPTEEG